MDNRKILFVDDDLSMHTIVKSIGPEIGLVVDAVNEGAKGLELGLKEAYELVILDLSLPDMGGMSILKQLRERHPTLPILLLTSRSAEVDKVLGLEIGADDYLTKPFGIHELVARVRSILRRKQAYESAGPGSAASQTEPLQVGELMIDFLRRRIVRSGVELEFSALEFDIIAYLARNRGRVVPREELLTQVWGYTLNATSNYESTVSTNLSRIRTKLEPIPDKPRFIMTVRGVGYRFAESADSSDE